jgi:nucleoid DNA-binding protein
MKNNFNWDEFLEVAQKLSKEKYDLEEEADFQDILDKRRDEIKDKIAKKEKTIEAYEIKDFIDVDPDQLSDLINSQANIKVGKFLVYNLRERHRPEKIQTKIMENKITGHGKDLICTVPVHKDFRFKEMPSVALFNKLSSSAKLTQEQLVEVVRWLQVIAKYDFLV